MRYNNLFVAIRNGAEDRVRATAEHASAAIRFAWHKAVLAEAKRLEETKQFTAEAALTIALSTVAIGELIFGD